MNAQAWKALGTCVAVLVAVAALLVAWRQTRAANTKVDRANSISGQANTLSSEANTVAACAVELAQSAEARADRLERMQTERRDVKSVHRSADSHDVASFQNVGVDAAHDVTLTVDLDDGQRRRDLTMTLIGGGEGIGIGLQAEARETRERLEGAMSRGIFIGGTVPFRARLTWRSAEGVPGIQDFDDLRT